MGARSALSAVRPGSLVSPMRDDRGKPVTVRKKNQSPLLLVERALLISIVIIALPSCLVWFIWGSVGAVLLSAILILLLFSIGTLLAPSIRDEKQRQMSHSQQSRLVRCCAACAYPLGSVVSDEDGCTVCPECGAAWKLESPDA